uniref:WxL domain-containing protein n=1 Tax=Enterococcus faecalis TaxID=1351 RepID=UPI00359C2F6D
MNKKRVRSVVATASLLSSTLLLNVAPIVSMPTASAEGIVDVNEWETTVDGDTTVLTNYTGQAKDVVIPMSGDLGTTNVKITKKALRAAATSADNRGGTLANSANDTSGKGLVADNSTDDNSDDRTVDYSGTFKDLTKITKVDLSKLKIEAHDGANGKDKFGGNTSTNGQDGNGENGQAGEGIDVSAMFENCMSLKEVNMNSFVGQGGFGGNGGNGQGGVGNGGNGGAGQGGNGGYAGNFSSTNMFENTPQLVDIQLKEFVGKSGQGGVGGEGHGGEGKNGNGGKAVGGIGIGGGNGVGGTGSINGGDGVGGASYGNGNKEHYQWSGYGAQGRGGEGKNGSGGNGYGGIGIVVGGYATGGKGAKAQGQGIGGNGGITAGNGTTKNGVVDPNLLPENLTGETLRLFNAYNGTTDKTNMFSAIAVNELSLTKKVGFNADALKANVAALRKTDSGKGENLLDAELANVTISVKDATGNAIDVAEASQKAGEYTVTYAYNGQTVDTHLKVKAIHTNETEGHVTITKGSIDIDPDKPIDPEHPDAGSTLLLPDQLNFGSTTISYDEDVNLKATKDGKPESEATTGTIRINDKRGTNTGWVVKVNQTQFKQEDSELTGAELSLTTGEATNVGGVVPTGGMINQKAKLTPGEETEIFKANANEGSGISELPIQQFDLKVPSTTDKKTGKYVTTITWTVSETA